MKFSTNLSALSPDEESIMTNVRELSDLSKGLKSGWNADLNRGRSPLEGTTVISRFEFVDVLNHVLVPDSAERVIWTTKSNDQSYYFPCYIDRKSDRLFSWLELKHIPDLYPGRSGPAFLIGSGTESVAFLNRIFEEQDRWHSFSLCVLADGPMERHLLETAKLMNYEPLMESSQEYPYIEFPATWDDFYGSLAKKFRYNIRNSQKLLSDIGGLSLERMTDEKDVPRFLEDAYAVERLSWKEDAGTSITTNSFQEVFHSRLAPTVASDRIFRGYVLYLDGSPIAHVYGLLCGNVFYSLKLSYSEQIRKYSPGTVMTALAIQDLISDGVKFWDFSGPMEAYKKRWTKDAYCLRTYTVFGRNVHGAGCSRLRRKIRRIFSSK